VSVTVVNDTSSNGIETTNAAALRKAGYKTVVPAATSEVLAKTTIQYPKGQESAAKALQAQVPGAVMDRSSQVVGVTLLLGNNGVQVKSRMASVPSRSPTANSPTSTSSGGTVASSAPKITTAADTGCID
jgi:hypothetical protein